MAKKQNGFGNPKSFSFKGNGKVDVGKVKGAAGNYPSNRRYGSTVQRTVIEHYNLNSNWVKWRKGFEYYNQAAWYRLEELDPDTGEYVDAIIKSVLFQGTDQEVEVQFDGYKFATKDADTNNHYVIKRSLDEETDYSFGTVRQVNADEKNDVVTVKINAGPNVAAVLNMVGDRITDGETSATIDYILNKDNLPGLMIGKTLPSNKAIATVRLPLNEVVNTPWMQDRGGDVQELVNEIVYLPDFYQQQLLKDITVSGEVADYPNYFTVEINQDTIGQNIVIFDYDDNDLLPPSLYDIKELPEESLIYEGPAADSRLSGTFVFQKALYQKYYGIKYLTGELALESREEFSYVILPFKVQSVLVQGDELLIQSVPFMAELKMYSDLTDGSIQFAPDSFTKIKPDLSREGWKILDTDVNPYLDEVFTSGGNLVPDTIYACSCPNYAKAMLRAPQQTQDAGTRKINRQRRYPLPTAMSADDYANLGINEAAGLLESWATRADQRTFKMCKHSIAAMFIEHIKVLEPNDYPTVESRIAFEEKLRKDIEEVAAEFAASYKRGGITALEVIFAMSQALGMDEIETAYVVLNANF